ncbi:zona pellucida sperm-binding protein 4-like [Cottoperca gobio]|uniref:Zona pellucida sperm-binding protein 4 n=1 Tax=Cottoperca gobio TaxID=56716 RepID=A0A6J2PT77_COTGO|nr:zona pellucida sperm-binding protein 4-like [Cottoperca gobio]
MAIKLLCDCLLAVALLGCLVEAQYFKKPKDPQYPQTPPNPQYPQAPPKPQYPQTPKDPQYPQTPPNPQYPQAPPKPQYPQTPPNPQYPQAPPKPQYPQAPPKPQYPQTPKDPYVAAETFHTCDAYNQHKVLCGGPAITNSECEAINCCFDGRTCYYGKSVTLQCTKDAQFIVVVARDATLPNIDLETITFNSDDEGCRPVGVTSGFAIYQFLVTNCGTVLTEEPGVIIYENKMSSFYEVAIGPNGAITRDSHYQLIVQCRYSGTSVEALVIEVGLLPPPLPVAALGPLRVELRLANGACLAKGCSEEEVAYNSFYVDSDYPVTKVLRDPVYVEIRILERTDPSIFLTLGRCWATADPYPHSRPQWDLLIEGCPYQADHYQTSLVPVDISSGLLYPSHHRRFIFKMFTFVGYEGASPAKGKTADPHVWIPLTEKVYIHCETAVCQPDHGNNCEPRCYRKRRDVIASVQRGFRDETTVVSSKELIITEPSRSIQ